jgi:dolichol kinase
VDRDTEPLASGTAGLSARRELSRKALHLLSSAVPLSYAAGASQRTILALLVGALVIAMTIEVLRARSARARAVFDARVGALLRPHEFLGLSGATWLLVAFFLAMAVYPRAIAIASMCAVALGDAAAAIVGRTLGGRAATGRKTIWGSVACGLVSAFAAHAIAGMLAMEALVVGVLAAIAERPTRPLDDNLRITLVVGCGILLWRMGFS